MITAIIIGALIFGFGLWLGRTIGTVHPTEPRQIRHTAIVISFPRVDRVV
jgi:hypothetical protein